MTMATSEWIQFFREAGIPPGPAVSYAVMFVDNRIQKNMLLDLTKEIIQELGITVVGDVIAILKHAKVAYRQEMCRAATESLPPPPEPRRNAAATRMIAKSLSREGGAPQNPPPRTPPPKISITVANKMAAAKAGGLGSILGENPSISVKRRRVTAEMEGKYIIRMPKGTTPRSRKILEQQMAKGLQRTSVFERLGGEAGAESPPGGKLSGVFSRLGDPSGTFGDKAPSPNEDSDDPDSVLQYVGVLKKPPPPKTTPPSVVGRGTPSVTPNPSGVTIKAKATTTTPPLKTPLLRTTPPFRTPPLIRGGFKPPPQTPRGKGGTQLKGGGVQDGDVVTSTKVTLRRSWGGGKGSSSPPTTPPKQKPPPQLTPNPPPEPPQARMDDAGALSVFQRLGRKPGGGFGGVSS